MLLLLQEKSMEKTRLKNATACLKHFLGRFLAGSCGMMRDVCKETRAWGRQQQQRETHVGVRPPASWCFAAGRQRGARPLHCRCSCLKERAGPGLLFQPHNLSPGDHCETNPGWNSLYDAKPHNNHPNHLFVSEEPNQELTNCNAEMQAK